MWRKVDMKRKGIRRNKRAMASVIGGLIVFSIMFTVVAGYFLTTTQQFRTLYSNENQKISEQFSVSAEQGSSGNISVIVTNTGAVALSIVGIIVINTTSGAVLNVISASPASTDTSNPKLPIAVNSELNSSVIDTGVPIKDTTPGSYTIKVITESGNVELALYPPAPTTSDLAFKALTSGALGDIYLEFNSYTYYGVVSCGSNYCLSGGAPGFTIPGDFAYPLAFAITMTNLNVNHSDIILDQFTLLYQSTFYGNQHENMVPWYIVSNTSTTISSNYIPIVLQYDVPQTVVFASNNCVHTPPGQGPNLCSNTMSPGSQAPGSNYIATVFIMMHGWELNPPVTVSSLSYSESNYGQNLPYVSTLYT